MTIQLHTESAVTSLFFWRSLFFTIKYLPTYLPFAGVLHFLDSSITVPTTVGLPLTLSVNGTACLPT